MKPANSAAGRVALLIGSCVVGILFWDQVWLLPFKLLAVMGHETGHALASLLVGGSVEQVTLRLNESGQCLSRIPEGFFPKVAVYSAGYVGSAIISVVLLLATFRFNARRAMLGAACVWLLLMGIFYARDGFTLLFSLVMAAVFGVSARFLPAGAVALVNVFIASFTGLYAAMDLKDDLWNSSVRAQSDAALLAEVTWVPALAWAALWTVVSLVVLLLGAWLALKDKPPGKPAPSAHFTVRSG